MAVVDIVILLLLVVSSLVGVFRGFVKEVLSLVSWTLAIICALTFYEPLAQQLPLPERLAPWVSGLLILVVILIVGTIISNLIHKLVKVTGLTGIDRSMGWVIGLIRGGIVAFALLVSAMWLSDFEEQSWWLDSKLIPVFLDFDIWLSEFIADFKVWLDTIIGQHTD